MQFGYTSGPCGMMCGIHFPGFEFKLRSKNAIIHDTWPTSEADYAKGAYDFINNPPAGTLARVGPNSGEILLYNPRSNTLVLMNKAVEVLTMYRPGVGRSLTSGVNPLDHFLRFNMW